MKVPNSKSYLEVLNWASSFLQDQGVDKSVAWWLLRERFNLSQTDFVIQRNKPMPESDYQQFLADIERASNHYPPQYILGHEWFYDRVFKVTPDTLIPRPETEEWFDYYIKKLGPETLRVIDVGTGSGVLAISHKLERPDDQVYASDISKATLEVAKSNAQALGAEVTFIQGDLLQPFIDQNLEVDLIISNPPYIGVEEWEDMDESVRQYEPKEALFAENKGLAIYQKLISQSSKLVSSKGMILLEIGYKQAESVQALLLETYPHAQVKVWTDFNGLDRLVAAIV